MSIYDPETNVFFKKPEVETIQHGPWNFLGAKGHILNKEQEEEYNQQLKLPHLPDMVFSQNRIRIQHESGIGIELNPLEALKHVNDHEDLVHVSMAKDWMEARKDSPHINKIIHPFDWTYTPTDYRGSCFSPSGKEGFKISSTKEGIDYEKLKEQEKILFFQEIILFEDELDDNGCSLLSSKLRVMPSGFFCLLRFYLRVDHTLIRVIDTRFYHQFGKPYILREYTERESKTSEIKVSPAIWKDSNIIANHLELKKELTEKMEFPQ